MKILITGGNGYIGKNLPIYLKGYDITIATRKNLDLLVSEQVDNFFKDRFYDVVIHTAIVGGSRLVVDSPTVVHDNVKMICNIVNNKSHYKKLISIGSGAELYASDTPYGMSKKIISDIINLFDEHYNLRVFGIFDENELNTRFIKSSIINYINNKDIVIHKNKYMDFFSFKDFVSVLEQYVISSAKLPKTFDCCYSKKYTLSEIAIIINSLENKKSKIRILEKGYDKAYTGNGHNEFNLNYTGLEKSIQNMFEVLKNNNDTL